MSPDPVDPVNLPMDATQAPPGAGGSSGGADDLDARIGDYTIVRELARGGMGVVYVARAERLDRLVALKVLLDAGASADAEARFRVEAEAAAKLRHPDIVAVHEAGTDRGRPFLVMDLIEGESLKARIRRDGPLDPLEAARLTERLARAMEHAHERSVLHRDMKPANVLLTPDGQPRITDLGLAKDLERSLALTQSGQMMGTPAYMPPEQVEGDLDRIGPRSDVYGLGATLFELLIGEPPFTGATAVNIVNAVLTRDPPHPCLRRPEVPPDLARVCLKCLAKDPAHRYPTAGTLADDLARFAAGLPVLGQPPPRGLKRWLRAHWLLAGSLAALVVSLGVSLVARLLLPEGFALEHRHVREF